MIKLLLIAQLYTFHVNIPFKFWSAQTENKEERSPNKGSGRRE